MELTDFFVLETQGLDVAAGWRWLESSRRMSVFGPDGADLIIDELIEPDRPVPFKVMRGCRAMDIYGTSGGSIVYSGRLVRALEEAGCTGLRSYRAVLYDETDTKLIDDDLRWIVPTSRAGAVEERRGAQLLVDLEYLESDPDYAVAYGLYFDTTTWPGTDLFRLEREQYRVLVTRRVVEIIESGSFEGIQIVPAPLYRKDLRDAAIKRRKQRKARFH